MSTRLHTLLIPLGIWLAVGFGGCTSPEPMQAIDSEIDELLLAYPEAAVAVVVNDPAGGMRYERLADRSFHAASTMKVPVMIEVFRRVEEGTASLDDPIDVENRFRSIVDGSEYRIEDDSDDAIYERLGQAMTVRELVVQMITVSSNLATNLLIDRFGAGSVQAAIEQLGTRHMAVLRGVEDLKAFERGMNNTATAQDLALLMTHLMEGTAVSAERDAQMRDVLMAQQFGEMIPAGLPAGARVAHKTGQITRIHHDAAIVYPEAGAPYVLVVLTEGIDDGDRSAALGAAISAIVYRNLRG